MKGGGTGFGDMHGDGAITTIGIATPAGKGRARRRGGGEGDHGAIGVGFRTVGAAIDARRRAGDGTRARTRLRHRQRLRGEVKGGSAGLGRIHGEHSAWTRRTPTPKHRARRRRSGEGDHGAMGVGFSTVGAARDARRSAGDGARACARLRHRQRYSRRCSIASNLGKPERLSRSLKWGPNALPA